MDEPNAEAIAANAEALAFLRRLPAHWRYKVGLKQELCVERERIVEVLESSAESEIRIFLDRAVLSKNRKFYRQTLAGDTFDVFYELDLDKSAYSDEDVRQLVRKSPLRPLFVVSSHETHYNFVFCYAEYPQKASKPLKAGGSKSDAMHTRVSRQRIAEAFFQRPLAEIRGLDPRVLYSVNPLMHTPRLPGSFYPKTGGRVRLIYDGLDSAYSIICLVDGKEVCFYNKGSFTVRSIKLESPEAPPPPEAPPTKFKPHLTGDKAEEFRLAIELLIASKTPTLKKYRKVVSEHLMESCAGFYRGTSRVNIGWLGQLCGGDKLRGSRVRRHLTSSGLIKEVIPYIPKVKAGTYQATGELKALYERFGVTAKRLMDFGGEYGDGRTNENLLVDVHAAVSRGWSFEELWVLVQSKSPKASEPVGLSRVKFLFNDAVKWRKSQSST